MSWLMPDWSVFFAVLVRYGVAGVINTAIGYAVILIMQYALGFDRQIANATGFAIGAIIGFILSRSYVFEQKGGVRTTGLRYVCAMAGAFTVNQLVLWAIGGKLDRLPFGAALDQLLAIASYSITLFAASRFWVFAPVP